MLPLRSRATPWLDQQCQRQVRALRSRAGSLPIRQHHFQALSYLLHQRAQVAHDTTSDLQSHSVEDHLGELFIRLDDCIVPPACQMRPLEETYCFMARVRGKRGGPGPSCTIGGCDDWFMSIVFSTPGATHQDIGTVDWRHRFFCRTL
jgi:hypothetical protein